VHDARLVDRSAFSPSSGEERRRDSARRADALNTAHKTRDCNRRNACLVRACCFTTRSKCHVIANKDLSRYFAPFDFLLTSRCQSADLRG